MESIPHWIRVLDEDDLSFVKRFVLNSGSLKTMGREYGVSYPTMRKRLDKLIGKIEVAEDPSFANALERLVGLLVADGVLHSGTGRTLVQAHYQAVREASVEDSD
jgi:hypothetical protein